MQSLQFVIGEIDLDDLLDAVRAQLARYTDKGPLDAVFTFEVGRAGQDRVAAAAGA